jgi:hypothetical protein
VACDLPFCISQEEPFLGATWRQGFSKIQKNNQQEVENGISKHTAGKAAKR